jgi:uncharacterized protein (TIGR03067 family)
VLEVRRRAEQILQAVTARLRAAAAAKELERFQGPWVSGGETFIVKGDRWAWTTVGAEPDYAHTIAIVEVRDTMTLADLWMGEGHPRKGQAVKAIFRLDGDTLHYCGTYDLPRPTEFVKGLGDPYYVAWKRAKK